MDKLVEMKNVTKKFPGVTALDDITFDILPGEVHILLGENGAGKSTLMKILSGVYAPTEGTITVKGKDYKSLTPKDSFELGISVIYQELSVINELSIMENMFIGRLPSKRVLGVPVIDYDYMKSKTVEALNMIGLDKNPEAIVESLSISEKQQIEIAKALISNADIIVMDEPTTSLTTTETDNLFRIIRELKKAKKGIVYISHKLKELKEIGDRVSVLKDGKHVGTREVKEMEIDDLVTMMVGRKVHGVYTNTEKIEFDEDEVILKVEGLTSQDYKVIDVSFEVRKGEIVGFSGLIGSGRTELMNTIFGSTKKKSGKIIHKGKEMNFRSPYDAIKNGFAMVTENRRETGFMHNFDIKENISIVPFVKDSKFQGLIGHLNNKFEKNEAETYKKKLRIKCRDIDQNIVELSGGNQQKVILGKWLSAGSEVIIFDEPTKGIDVGSKSEIYELMRNLATDGKAVLVVSSELPELLSVSDTIHVFRDGGIVQTFTKNDATEEKIVKASTADIEKVMRG